MKWNSIMAHNFTLTNTLKDLRMNISTRHISYLCEDKSLDKLKYQNLLQNHIKEYICIVHHRQKFSFAKTAEVLQRSVCSPKFNALKAAKAWLHLSTYANNLYSQPWRKEYQEIKLYSGFYKHQIENCLSGAEAIFELMGYNRVNGDKMVIEGPLNVQQLAATSLDALIAMCECQVFFTVFRELSKHLPTITWPDILLAREAYPGTAEQTIEEIVSRYAHCADCHGGYSRYQAPALPAPGCRKCALAHSQSVCAAAPLMNGYRAAAYHLAPSMGARYQHSAAPPALVDHLPFANGHYHHVPTAKLIDYDDSLDGYPAQSVGRRHVPASVDRWNWMPECAVAPSTSGYRHHRAATDARYLPSSSSESASYEEEARPSRSSARLSVDRGAASTSAASSHTSGRRRTESSGSEVSHRSRAALAEEEAATCRENPGKMVSAAAEEPAEADSSAASSDTRPATTWACWNCTYCNGLRHTVCEMCGKSRNTSAEASLVSGGKQCKYCTLVNQREATKCEACDNSLENSPTYV